MMCFPRVKRLFADLLRDRLEALRRFEVHGEGFWGSGF